MEANALGSPRFICQLMIPNFSEKKVDVNKNVESKFFSFLF